MKITYVDHIPDQLLPMPPERRLAAEIVVGAEELGPMYDRLDTEIPRRFLDGVDPHRIDQLAIAQIALNTARHGGFDGALLRGNLFVLNIIAHCLRSSMVRPGMLLESTVPHAEFFASAAAPTAREHQDMLHIDISPDTCPPTVMPANAYTLHRTTHPAEVPPEPLPQPVV